MLREALHGRADCATLSDEAQAFLGRVRRTIWVGSVALVLLSAVVHRLLGMAVADAFAQAIGQGVVFAGSSFAMVLMLNRLAIGLSRPPGAAERAVQRRVKRLENVVLATRTMQAQMNNQLALSVGYGELLTRSPRLPDDLRLQAEEALRGAEEAAETLARLCRIACADADQPVGTPIDGNALAPRPGSLTVPGVGSASP